MAQFLSVEWMDALNQAAAGDSEIPPAGNTSQLTLQQVVTHPDGTSTDYAVCVEAGRVLVRPGRVDQADVALTTDYDTAVGISRGEVSTHAALLAGRVRVRGDSGGLVRVSDVLARAQARWDSVRAQTKY